jgi:hypothetical protein
MAAMDVVCLSDATSEDAQALGLDDELFWLRAANLTAAENIGRWRTMMDDAANEDERQQFLDKISAAEKAMHRNTARIESLELTKASIEHRLASAEKVTLKLIALNVKRAIRITMPRAA